jgi:uncharacterized membrane protein YgcG
MNNSSDLQYLFTGSSHYYLKIGAEVNKKGELKIMTRKITVGLIVTAVVLTLLVSSVALAQDSDATLEALYEQIYELQRQVVERRVELGNLTEEEGDWMLTRMEERFLENGDEGSGGFYGMPGRGRGGGFGGIGGFGHCWR